MPPVCVAASSGERADENGGLDVGGAAEQVGPGNTRPAGSHRIRPMKSGVTFTPSAPVRLGAGFSIARERLRCSRICARHANGPGEVARRHHCGWQLRCALDTLLDPLLDRRCRRRGGRLLFQVRDRVARSQRQRADIVDPGERGSDPRPLYLLEGNQVTERSVGSEQWGRFLIAIFDEWIWDRRGEVMCRSFRCGARVLGRRAGVDVHVLGDVRHRPVRHLPKARHVTAVLPRVHGALRLSRRVSEESLHLIRGPAKRIVRIRLRGRL